MSLPAVARSAPVSSVRIGLLHGFALLAVWLTFASSAVVFTEPAPVDALMLGLIYLLPVIGLVRITPPLLLLLAIWMTAACAALVATVQAVEPGKALVHTTVTLFLTGSSFVVSAFVMRQPHGHTRLIFNAYLVAAVVAVVAALVGYFRLLPGAFELFTRYGRAAGTFKDPNVFGPFLVVPAVYLLHRVLIERVGRAVVFCGVFGLLVLGVLLSFSRGAWFNLAVSIGVFGYLSFLTARTDRQRLKILCGALGGVLIGVGVALAALQFDGIERQFASRATIDQTYDQGPEGRFGGQEKARRLILENPLGIGAQQFAPHHHVEEPHNVYLAMYLNAGWLGGTIFAVMVALTCLLGVLHAFRRTEAQPLFLVAYACFVAHVVQGFVIDLDHWRHFHLLMAVIWGLMLGDRARATPAPACDPAAVFQQADVPVPSREPRIMRPQRTAAVPRKTYARRSAGTRDDSRPGRARGRTFARDVPEV